MEFTDVPSSKGSEKYLYRVPSVFWKSPCNSLAAFRSGGIAEKDGLELPKDG